MLHNGCKGFHELSLMGGFGASFKIVPKKDDIKLKGQMDETPNGFLRNYPSAKCLSAIYHKKVSRVSMFRKGFREEVRSMRYRWHIGGFMGGFFGVSWGFQTDFCTTLGGFFFVLDGFR